MNNTLRRVSILAGILFVGTALAGYVRDGFEGKANGAAPGGDWTVSHSSVMVTNVGGNAHSGTNALVVPNGKIVTNTVGVGAGVSNVVWTDFWTVPRSYQSEAPAPDLDLNATAQFFLSNGYWVVFSGPGGSITNVYNDSDVYGTNLVAIADDDTTWRHVSVCQDYSNKLWHLFVDGVPIATNLGFINQGVSNYEWFAVRNLATGSSEMTLLDDVLITNAVPDSLVTDKASGSANNLRDAWELMYAGQLASGWDAATPIGTEWTYGTRSGAGLSPYLSLTPSQTVVYVFGTDSPKVTHFAASDVAITLRLTVGANRTNRILYARTPSGTFTNLADFYTGSNGENTEISPPYSLVDGSNIFLKIVAIAPGPMIRTNGIKYAMYRQARSQVPGSNVYYAVGIPVDYGASNKLDKTLGQDLAKGLRGDDDQDFADTIQFYNPLAIAHTYYLNADTNWVLWDAFVPATDEVPQGVGVLIKSRGLGGVTNGSFALFSGTTVTNQSLDVGVTATSFSMLSWPYNSTTANWTNSLNEVGRGSDIVTNSDAIWLLRNGKFTTRMILKADGWYYDFPNPGTRVTTPMNPGEGFFYHNKQGGFSWSVPNPDPAP